MAGRYIFAQFTGWSMSQSFGVSILNTFLDDTKMNWETQQVPMRSSRSLITHGKTIQIQIGDWLIIDTETNTFFQHLHYLIK